MSSSARIPSDEPTAFTPLLEVPQERRDNSAELRAALRGDQADLQREVIAWQRRVRYLALGALTLLSLVFGRAADLALAPLAVIGGVYIAFVAAAAWYVSRSPGRTIRGWLPAMLLTADITTIAAVCYLISTPQQMFRILLLGMLSVQLSVFYFGARQGSWAALLTCVSYLLLALRVPPYVPGARPSTATAAFNATLFAIIAAVLVYTFGSFRERMNRMRLFCKMVEAGDMTGTLGLTTEKRPDDLTLLARSFEAMRNRLAELVGTDPLTGCLNRRALEERLRADWRQAKRRGSNVALLAIDLDHFKDINDSRGHPVGDVVLQQLAGIMKSTARDTDAVARFGGDEFVILLPDTGWQGALTFGERLRRRVDDFQFGPATAPLAITISVGVALARGTDPISPDVLLAEADRSLYKAKSGGRNRVFA